MPLTFDLPIEQLRRYQGIRQKMPIRNCRNTSAIRIPCIILKQKYLRNWVILTSNFLLLVSKQKYFGEPA